MNENKGKLLIEVVVALVVIYFFFQWIEARGGLAGVFGNAAGAGGAAGAAGAASIGASGSSGTGSSGGGCGCGGGSSSGITLPPVTSAPPSSTGTRDIPFVSDTPPQVGNSPAWW